MVENHLFFYIIHTHTPTSSEICRPLYILYIHTSPRSRFFFLKKPPEKIALRSPSFRLFSTAIFPHYIYIFNRF
ncbi:hypothetical protein L2E82_28600 [Cichorium intybus]|uniref:Uncharacterized protein n=1 Tax=Cichorium intybus TaxID=13427 RepID=A0ACB9CW66_CICIN|nr:hypothetical protein L2E82_28600 [Cichorium intybus]